MCPHATAYPASSYYYACVCIHRWGSKPQQQQLDEAEARRLEVQALQVLLMALLRHFKGATKAAARRGSGAAACSAGFAGSHEGFFFEAARSACFAGAL